MKWLKPLLFLSIFLIIHLVVEAQPELLAKLKQKTNKEEKIQILIEISNFNKNSDLGLAIKYAKLAYQESLLADLPKLSGTSLSQIGLIHYLNNQIDSAIYFHEKASVILQNSGDSFEISRNSNRLGADYYLKGKLKEAIIKYQEAIQLTNDMKIKANALNNLGMCSKQFGDFSKAITYHSQALGYYEILDDPNFKAKTLNNLGSCYWLKKDIQKSFESFSSGYIMAISCNNPEYLAQSLNGLGIIFSKNKNFDSAIFLFTQASILFQKLGFQKEFAQQLVNLADNETESGKLLEAEANYNRALQIFFALNDESGQAAIYNNQGNLFQKKKDWKNAAISLEKAFNLSKNSQNINHTVIIARNLSFVYEKLQLSDKALTYRKIYDEFKEEVTDLAENLKYIEVDNQLKITQKEKELVEKNEEISKIKGNNVVLGFTILIILVVSGFMYKAFRKKKANQFVLEANISSIEKQIESVKNENFSLKKQLLQTEEELIKLNKKYEGKKEDLPNEIIPLSKREHEVLLYMAEGLPDKEIADKLFVSVNTVRTHTRRIYDKLLVNNRTEAINMLHKFNLLTTIK
jgi:DNA-binding CsgD family transcriptional regulator/Tfp pilus assembly protein PilF